MKSLVLSACLLLVVPAIGQSSRLSTMRLAVLVQKDSTTSAAGLAHNHGIEAKNVQAMLNYDASHQTCSCEIVVPVEHLDVDSPEVRKFVGLSDVLEDDTRQSVRENMLGSDQ